MLIIYEVTTLLRLSMLFELVSIPLVNDDTLSSIVWMPEENVLMPIMFDVTILFRASILSEFVTIPFLNEVTLSSIAVMV